MALESLLELLTESHISDGMRNKPGGSEPDYDCGGSFYHPNNFMGNTMTGAPPNMLHGPNMNSHLGNNSTGPGGHMILNPIDRLYSMQNMYFCGEKLSDDQI